MDNIYSNKPTLIDRIKGMIYGHCLGSAIGLTTEFKTKGGLSRAEFPYKAKIRDFPIGDWTDGSDNMIIVMQSLSSMHKLDQLDIAARLKHWAANGFAELGDSTGMGCSGLLRAVIGLSMFTENPTSAALEIWNKTGQHGATNNSIARTPVLSACAQKEAVREMSAALSNITHPDPRCVASCVLFNEILWDIIHTGAAADGVLTTAIQSAREYIKLSQPGVSSLTQARSNHETEFAKWVKTGYTMPIAALQLSDMAENRHVFKSLGVIVWTLHVVKWAQTNSAVPSFKKTITKIAEECGHASMNCAVGGALLGAYIGYDKLPGDWLRALPHLEWLDQHVNAFIEFLFRDKTAVTVVANGSDNDTGNNGTNITEGITNNNNNITEGINGDINNDNNNDINSDVNNDIVVNTEPNAVTGDSIAPNNDSVVAPTTLEADYSL